MQPPHQLATTVSPAGPGLMGALSGMNDNLQKGGNFDILYPERSLLPNPSQRWYLTLIRCLLSETSSEPPVFYNRMREPLVAANHST